MGETGVGKVAIVTGGTRGIGAAIVRRLLAEGYAVATCGRTAPEEPIGVDGKTAEFAACDIREPAAVNAWIADLVARGLVASDGDPAIDGTFAPVG